MTVEYKYIGPEYKTGVVIGKVTVKDPGNTSVEQIEMYRLNYPNVYKALWDEGSEKEE